CDPPLEPRSGPGAGSPSRRERLASPRPSGRPTVGWSVPRSRAPRTRSLRRCGSRAHRGVWFRSAAGRPGSRPGSPRGDPAVAVGSSLDVAVGWVCAWAWSFPLRRECRKTTIINGRVGEEKPRSKAPILSDRSRGEVEAGQSPHGGWPEASFHRAITPILGDEQVARPLPQAQSPGTDCIVQAREGFPGLVEARVAEPPGEPVVAGVRPGCDDPGRDDHVVENLVQGQDDARGFLAGRGGCDLTLIGPAQVQTATEETLLVGLFLSQPEVGGVIPEIADAQVLDANHPRGRNVLIV